MWKRRIKRNRQATVTLREFFWRVSPFDREAKRLAASDYRSGSGPRFSDEQHLFETVGWLARAQDNADGGVSRAYKVTRHLGRGLPGWQPAYPETTGYIIPTFFTLAEKLRVEQYRRRAISLADWETDIQMESGAVMGSVVTAPKSPAIFNTGQVIFGWLAGYRETGNTKYLDSAKRAADFLVSSQEPDGSWRRANSQFALSAATTYNTRVAWALVEFGLHIGRSDYAEAGKRNVEFALTRQRPNGWFENNCLNDPLRPLLHTIVYATRGILETGILLNESRYVDAAAKALDQLIICQRPDGGLPGRLTADWTPAANWDCVTGDAQAAVAWLRLHATIGGERYLAAAKSVIEFVKVTQDLGHVNPGIRGGVKGSFPFDRPYGRFEMLNWAAKFFVDALLMINDEQLALRGIRG